MSLDDLNPTYKWFDFHDNLNDVDEKLSHDGHVQVQHVLGRAW